MAVSYDEAGYGTGSTWFPKKTTSSGPAGTTPGGSTYSPADYGDFNFTQEEIDALAGDINNWFPQQYPQPQTSSQTSYGGGSSTPKYGDISSMLTGLGSILGPQQAPQLQTMAMPELQQYTPTAIAAKKLGQYQTWTPEMLGYQDFSPMEQNIGTIYDQTTGTINNAFSNILSRLSQPYQTAVSSVAPTSQQLSPELGQLASVLGISPQYQQSLGAANSGIQSNADLFAGRGALLDRALMGARDVSRSTAEQGLATALSQAGLDRALTQAALQSMIMRSNQGIDQYNNQLVNQAGQMNSQGLNEWAMAQAQMDNQIAMANAAAQNAAAQYNTGAANDAMLQWLMTNTGITNQQALADAAAARPDVSSLLQLITGAAGMGQNISPELLQGLIGAA